MSINQLNLQNKFNHEYNKLGLQERTIIDDIDGLVKIVASPDEAIIKILAIRIAKILSFTGTKPENIYWFTTGDALNITIQKKLHHFIGADATKINILCFESFCKQVIQEIRGLTDNRLLRQISTVEHIQLLKKLIAGFPDKHPLKRFRGDVYHELSNLMMLFSLMKTEGFTSESLIQKMNDSLTEQPKEGETNHGFEPVPNPDNSILIEKMRAATREFDHYQNLLQANRRYDTGDIINLIIKAFEGNKNLLSHSQDNFKYLLVDDFGNMGYPARKLFQLLIGANHQPNLWVVDYDYDQQIIPNSKDATFKYPGSFPSHDSPQWKTINFDHRYNHLKDQEIFNHPVINSYNSESDETAGIANQVYDLLQQNTAANNIAVIYQEDEYGTSMERYFTAKNIPVYFKRNIPVLKHPFIKKIFQLLRYISTEQSIPFSGDDLLFEILHYDFYEIPPAEIAKLVLESNSKKHSKTLTPIRKLLGEKAHAPAKDLFDTGINKNLKAFSILIEKILKDHSKHNIQAIFENIVQHALILPYIDNSREQVLLRELLAGLNDFIKTESTCNPHLQLHELIAAIDTMEQASLPLYINYTTGTETGVQLIQAPDAQHREFKFAFIAGANTTMRQREDWLNNIWDLPGINFNPRFIGIDGSRYRSLVQLFYRLIHQNSTHLFVSFAKNSNGGKTLAPDEFLADYLTSHSIPVNHKVLTADELSQYLGLIKIPSLPEIAQTEEFIIAPILKKFVMNVSALNNYLNCPLGFYFKNIIRIPPGKSESMEFGTAIHYALENLFKKMSAGYPANGNAALNTIKQYQFPSATSVVEDFNWYMQSRRSYFTEEAFERRMGYGSEALHNYYHQYIHSWNKVVSVERNMRAVTINDIPIKGKLDKIEFYGNDVIIVDYKSGDIEKAMSKLNPPNDDNPTGGDYWRQAVFYKLLVDHYEQKDWKVNGVEFDFVEPDKKGEFRKVKLEVNAADIETIIQQIKEVWGKIQSRQFYTGCGKQHCHWCNLVKDNNLAVALHHSVPAASTN